jgi:hypothetical protein
MQFLLGKSRLWQKPHERMHQPNSTQNYQKSYLRFIKYIPKWEYDEMHISESALYRPSAKSVEGFMGFGENSICSII